MAIAASSPVKKLFQKLIYSSIQRCRLSESLCRLSVAIKCFHASKPSSLRISNGVLSITTTGNHDKDIFHFRLNLKKPLNSETCLNKLPSTRKSHATFSGTEVCLFLVEEDDVDDLVAWFFRHVQKILILKVPKVAVEVLVEHVDSQGSRHDRLLQEIDDIHLPLPMPSIERLLCGFQSYTLKHRNSLEKECEYCLASREHLYVGTGFANNKRNARGLAPVLEAVILIASASSSPCCQETSTSQVMYFQDFAPSSVSQSCISALTSIDWHNYGLRLKGTIPDEDGNALLEWEDITPFRHFNIALHSYCKNKVANAQQREQTLAEVNLIKRAVKVALDDMKRKYAGPFLSSRALKISKYVPDLSRAIACVISSSSDFEFQRECAALIGLNAFDGPLSEAIEPCIREKIIKIIETNDGRRKVDKETAPYLFECEGQLEEYAYPDEGEIAEEDAMDFDF